MNTNEDVFAYSRRVHRRNGAFKKEPAPGRIRMHNQVRPQTADGRDMIGLGHWPCYGLSGFRVWTQDADPEATKECDCGYMGLKHYVWKQFMEKSRKGEMYTPAEAAALAATD
jgi:hypothetical protein